MIILSPIIIYYYVKEYRKYKNTVGNCYDVEFCINKKKYNLKGYLDTGNTLIDPYKKRGVILLNLDKLKIEDINKKNKKENFTDE